LISARLGRRLTPHRGVVEGLGALVRLVIGLKFKQPVV
jgi:hypothetical protein